MDTKEKLARIQEIVQALLDSYKELEPKAPTSPVDTYFLKKIEEWASKIFGISGGYEAEFLQMYKHRTLKGRSLLEGHADVTVGDASAWEAKSIQLKNTIQDHSAVSRMISEAINQLAGERGETPRVDDRLVVDMSICNNDNTWPLGAHTLGSMTMDEFQTATRNKLFKLITEHQPHNPQGASGRGMSYQTIQKRLTDVQTPTTQLSQIPNTRFPKSTQLATYTINHVQGSTTYQKVIHFTIKIRYKYGFPIRHLGTNGWEYRYLKLAVFNSWRSGNTLHTELAKQYFF
ncbi:hypothetical protein [Jeongeupia naejangsanensis]|uniref:Uncharacterized protein n=1 Tax=Jeongeupia naejangsanensis TaxID=613195 RepID=A0ABS2BL66_9NEIS|nr:hypothetical protein [Jeongeupia naejangsanensis]MBM3116357.1 hypothetical protein [Jeongeupia naejangsanensis]